MRVLVIEGDQLTAAALARRLAFTGLDVDIAVDGDEGFGKLQGGCYDVVVLERDLRGISGDEICWRLRSVHNAPRLLMLTARGGIEDVVSGLELGADDYLTKPFADAELVARVRALGRRRILANHAVLRCGDLELEPHSRSVHRAGVRIALANKEFHVLEALLRADGAVVSTQQLLDQVWDERADPRSTAVRVTMRTLRMKLGYPPILQTVVRAGYRVAEPSFPTCSIPAPPATELAIRANLSVYPEARRATQAAGAGA